MGTTVHVCTQFGGNAVTLLLIVIDLCVLRAALDGLGPLVSRGSDYVVRSLDGAIMPLDEFLATSALREAAALAAAPLIIEVIQPLVEVIQPLVVIMDMDSMTYVDFHNSCSGESLSAALPTLPPILSCHESGVPPRGAW